MKTSIYAIRTLLRNSGAVMATISSDSIHYSEQDQNSPYPAVVLSEPDAFPTETLSGDDNYPWRARVSIDCRSEDPDEIDELASAVEDALRHVGQTVTSELLIQECRLVGLVRLRDPGSDIYRVVMDYRVHYRPA